MLITDRPSSGTTAKPAGGSGSQSHASANAGAPRGPAAQQQQRSGGTHRNTLWIGRRRYGAASFPPPGEAEVARMVAEFHARGGQVTQCATAHALPVHNGAGRDAARWTA